MKNKISFACITVSISSVIAFSCKKEIKTPEQQESSTETEVLAKSLSSQRRANTPNLPPTPFDYSTLVIPSYLSGLISDQSPVNNPITNDGATLGRVLFYDRKLSVNNTISCGSCHSQNRAFADNNNAPFSVGFAGGLTTRNSMAIMNERFRGNSSQFFWDHRATGLEAQSLMPITHPVEMGMPDLATLEIKLASVSYYPDLFQKAFGTTQITSDKISKALSQFMRSITSLNSKYDQGVTNNFSSFSESEKRGFIAIKGKGCTDCHSLRTTSFEPNPTFLTTGLSNNTGLDAVTIDPGVGGITGNQIEMAVFKSPTLRNIVLSAPYMHDGRFNTLEEVVEFYSTGVQPHPNLDFRFNFLPRNFTKQEKKDLVNFLKTLTDQSFVNDPKFADPFVVQ